MDKGDLVSIAGVLILLSLAGGVSAGEETVSISVDVPMKGYTVETTSVSSVSTWHSMDIELDENFTFTFIADNLVNGTEYAFSYEIYTVRGDELGNASHLFVVNGTEEYSYNLEGQLGATFNWSTSATLEAAGGPNYSAGNCTEFIVQVSFVKNPNGTSETLATFQTNSFRPSGYIYEACNPGVGNLWQTSYGLEAFLIVIIAPIFFIFTVYKMFKLIFRPEEGTNSNTWALFWLMMMILSIGMFFYFSMQI